MPSRRRATLTQAYAALRYPAPKAVPVTVSKKNRSHRAIGNAGEPDELPQDAVTMRAPRDFRAGAGAAEAVAK